MLDNIVEMPDNEQKSGKTRAVPVIDLEQCTGCGDCVEWCPTGAVALIDGKPVLVRGENCNYCTDCETVCPSGAINCPFEIILVNRNKESQ